MWFTSTSANTTRLIQGSFRNLHPKPIQATQPLDGASFVGQPAQAKQLGPKFQYEPESTCIHLDSGNTNTQDEAGPLGNKVNITSVDTILEVLLWDTKGRLFAAYQGPCNNSQNSTVAGSVEVDPDTLEITAGWTPPQPNTTLNLAYIEMLTETDEVVASSLQGCVYIVKRTVQDHAPAFDLSRTFDLEATGVLQGIQLLNSAFDTSGNLWFTTGLVRGVLGTTPQNATIAGYVTPNGAVHSISIPNQMPENGIAINNDTVYLITGPTYADDHENVPGFMMALAPCTDSETAISVLWNATYGAGSSIKPGSFARGSGTTPTLLGDSFIAVTDNADEQLIPCRGKVLLSSSNTPRLATGSIERSFGQTCSRHGWEFTNSHR